MENNKEIILESKVQQLESKVSELKCLIDKLEEDKKILDRENQKLHEEKSKWVGKYNEESTEKWKYKNAFDKLFEKISEKRD